MGVVGEIVSLSGAAALTGLMLNISAVTKHLTRVCNAATRVSVVFSCYKNSVVKLN